jgi:ribose 5-phosphate isomerase B
MIAIGADHRGFLYKEYIKSAMPFIKWIDVGTYCDARCDYPVFAKAATDLMLNGTAKQAVLLCATGVGMAIAANRHKKIYAAVAWSAALAQACKEDDNVNVLVLPADFVEQSCLVLIVTSWLNASFKGERYAERLALIDEAL